MEPEINQIKSRLAPLQKVTPFSKYLAITLFIVIPFIGGWMGYVYGSEKDSNEERAIEAIIPVVQNQDEVDDNLLFPESVVKVVPNDPAAFLCTHKNLKNIDHYDYSDWPVYESKEFGILFSYPPDRKPNHEEKFTGADGIEYLNVGYNPNIDWTESDGKGSLADINDSWEVEIHNNIEEVQMDYDDLCHSKTWCMAEKLDFKNNFDTTVYTAEDEGILYTEERGYHITSNNGLVINLYLPAASEERHSEDLVVSCKFVSGIYNLDLIAHSLELLESS